MAPTRPAAQPVELDARGERCPIPVIRLGALLRDLVDGDQVRLLATDPAARTDVAAFCRMRGHRLVGVEDLSAQALGDTASTASTASTAYTAFTVQRGG